MKKHILSVLLIAVITILSVYSLSINSYANDKEYNVDQATFEVYFDENGDAIVTESWDVTYLKGDFTRFYKDIYWPKEKLEVFDEVVVNSVVINGQPGIPTNEIDRIDYHYYFEPNSDTRTDTIHWFYGASQQTVNYQITYTLKNVVKLNYNDDAIFVYRFIGENFPKTVGKTKVIIHTKDGNDIRVNQYSHGNYRVEDDSIIFEADNVNGILKYSISMDKHDFSDLRYADDVKIPKKKTKITFEDVVGRIISGAFGLVFLVGIIAAIDSAIRTAKEKAYIKKELKQNPYFLKSKAEYCDGYNVPAMWIPIFANKDTVSNFKFEIFFLEIFDLCKRNKMEVNKEGLKISKASIEKMNSQPGIENELDAKFVNILESYFGTFDNAGLFEGYSFETIKSVLSSSSRCIEFTNSIDNWFDEYKNTYNSTDIYMQLQNTGNISEIREHIEFLSKYLKYEKVKTSTYDCIGILSRNCNVSFYDACNLVFSRNYIIKKYNRSSSDDYYYDDEYFYDFCYFIDSESVTQESSSSSGSGCSSCSSCGGCGGGGAD